MLHKPILQFIDHLQEDSWVGLLCLTRCHLNQQNKMEDIKNMKKCKKYNVNNMMMIRAG